MADQTIDIPFVGPVTFPATMSDADIINAAGQLHADGLAASRQKLSEANAKPLPPTPTLADEFTPSKMVGRAWEGAKGQAEGLIGGVLALPAAVGYGVMHPKLAKDAVVNGVTTAVGGGLHALTNLKPDPFGLNFTNTFIQPIASDPRRIGNVTGGIEAAIAGPKIVGAIKGTKVGGAISSGVSDAVNRIPGVRAARDAYAAATTPTAPPPTPMPPGVDPYMPNVSTAADAAPALATEAGALPRVKQAVYIKTADGYGLAPAVSGETLAAGERVNVSTRAGRQMMATVPEDAVTKALRDSILGKLRDK